LLHKGDWPLLANQRSTLFHVEDGDGYNPTQLLRYWSFVRAAEPKHINYNAAFLIRPPPVARNLLQVAWVIAGTSQGTAVRLRGFAVQQAVAEGRYELYRVPDSPPRASALGAWTLSRSPDLALAKVLAPGYPVNGSVVLEDDPGFASGPRREAVPARFDWLGLQAVRVDVEVGSPAVVLVRNAYDPGWHASVDGRPAPVLAADYVDQGVPVPAGRHTVLLSYDDPTVGYGLVGTALSLVALLGAAAFLGTRRKSESDPNRPPADGEEEV
jgi:hypothetical protein